MNQIKHQIKMSSSLSSAVRSSKTSSSIPVPVPAGQRRFPDGYVGPADMPFCKVCYDAGLPVANYTNHFVKDQPGPGGKVVCPTLLAQKCLKCGLAGHTSSYCAGSRAVVVDPERTARLREEREQAKKANGGWETVSSDTKPKAKPRIEDFKPKTVAVPASTTSAASKYGSFGVLAVDESSSSSEDERQEIQKTPAPAPAPVPVPAPATAAPVRDPTKPLSWAQRAAAAASKPTPSSAPTPASTSSKLLSDTRFALHHALCENITVSKRAPPRGTSSESSKKRKQESVTVPA